MASLNWGILGASNFAATVMGPAINEANGARLAGLATGTPAKAAPFQAFAPDLTVFSSYDALLASPDIEAVYIPLPNHLHVEWTHKALAAGKHVLTEKPLAMTAPEIDALIAERDRTGLLAAEAYMIVHNAQWIKARALLAAGAIGDLCHVDVAFSFNNTDLTNIRNRPETGGGGIRDIGVYAYGSVRFATGQEPESLAAQIVWENGVDAVAHVQAQFPGFSYRAMTSIRMCPRQEVVFHGKTGVMRLTAPFNADRFGEQRIAIEGADGEHHIYRFPMERQYKNQVENFGRSVRDGVAYPWTLEDARGTQAMIDAVFAAAGPAPE